MLLLSNDINRWIFLTCEEESRQRFVIVIAFILFVEFCFVLCSFRFDWRSKKIVVGSWWSNFNVAVRTTSPRISSPTCDDGFLRLWNSLVSEDSLQHCNTSTDDNVIRNVLHDMCWLTGDQCQQHRQLIDVPEQEEFALKERRVIHREFIAH